MEARGDRYRRRFRRMHVGFDMHLYLVVYERKRVALSVLERDVYFVAQHDRVQLESAVALRRLLPAVGLARNPEYAPKSDEDYDAKGFVVVFRDGAAGRPVFAEAQSRLVRALHDRRRVVPLGRYRVDFVLRLPLFRRVRLEGARADHRRDVALRAVDRAALEDREVFLGAGENLPSRVLGFASSIPLMSACFSRQSVREVRGAQPWDGGWWWRVCLRGMAETLGGWVPPHHLSAPCCGRPVTL